MKLGRAVRVSIERSVPVMAAHKNRHILRAFVPSDAPVSEERAVHDGEDAGRDWRSGLLQDTALESDTQIETWAGGVRLYMT